MTLSVYVIFEYHCIRCGNSWVGPACVPTPNHVVFVACAECRTILRPTRQVKTFFIKKNISSKNIKFKNFQYRSLDYNTVAENIQHETI